ncbi:hypothetical protein N7449_007281 [Penicillium cf. viridicatum]|uniref:RapZ C-terminal domain-containing protein n=1 Tax=Penicillium cf. viridicatum TaxID=2972119 RepID=A0A9W9JI52_9EURO|nr:hypothetical protein N7449_007281 [Penicillium cf. viridicatum]
MHYSKGVVLSENQKAMATIVTMCCEQGRHRSVAFVEELAKRLSLLRDGADMSRSWKLIVTTFHRDLEALGLSPMVRT